mgnify:CR=1 FL=1
MNERTRERELAERRALALKKLAKVFGTNGGDTDDGRAAHTAEKKILLEILRSTREPDVVGLVRDRLAVLSARDDSDESDEDYDVKAGEPGAGYDRRNPKPADPRDAKTVFSKQWTAAALREIAKGARDVPPATLASGAFWEKLLVSHAPELEHLRCDSKRQRESNGDEPEDGEDDVHDSSVRDVRDATPMPSLASVVAMARVSDDPFDVAHDAAEAAFEAIVSDLFPGVEVPEVEQGDLARAIIESLEEHELQNVDKFVLKVVQMYETFNVRFGAMLVGPTGGGKTTVYRMLQSALTKLRRNGHENDNFQVIHTYVFNPKCIKMGELYGEYNLMTNEWTDGLGSTLIRNAVADTTPDKKWVVFDGPVDAIWIENMNTVLDDNCTLCLPNGERIKLNPNTMRMLFEVQDLAVASPATVSRCGMVWFSNETVHPSMMYHHYLQRLQ